MPNSDFEITKPLGGPYWKRLLKWNLIAGGIGFFACILSCLVQFWPFRYESAFPLNALFSSTVPIVVIPLVLIVIFGWSSFLDRKHRGMNFIIWTTCVSFFLGAWLSAPISGRLETERWSRFDQRSTVLIDAIAKYSEDHGSPPEKLENLIPHYIAAIPETELIENSNYSYLAGKDASNVFKDEPWVLYVDLKYFGLGQSWLVYLPGGHYGDSRIFNRTSVRYGRWASMHWNG